MKTFFASAVVASVALAQDYYYDYSNYSTSNSTETSTESYNSTTWIEDHTIVNEAGQRQFDMPAVGPVISWNELDEQEIMDWAAGVESDYNDLNQQWAEAWLSYEDAIAQPWNDFLSQSEDLNRATDQLEIQTTEEVITFVAENTFVDGEALIDAFPEIEEWLVQMEEQASAMSEAFNLDALRIQPRALHYYDTYGYYDDYGNYYPYETDYYYEEENYGPPEWWTNFTSKMADAIVSYGYDQDVVSAWFANKGSSWEELMREQEKERAQKAQADIGEASDYVKDILDNMVTDVEARTQQASTQLLETLDVKVEELKAEVDRQSAENIQNLQDFIDGSYDEVKEFTEASYEELEEVFTPDQDDSTSFNETAVWLATEVVTEKAQSGNSAYGYAAVTLGAIGLAAFLYKKRQQEKNATLYADPLIDPDQEFERV